MSPDAEVLVLGGGISGCLIAAGLADRGLDVSIVEQRPLLMSGASRWNDGKIHLGYTFTGTPSLATARLMQAGSAAFVTGLERALGEAIPTSWFGSGAIYLVDAGTLVDAETLWMRAQQVARLHAESAGRLVGMRRYLEGQPMLERLDPECAQEQTRQRGFVAAWRTPERHVSARAVADRLARAMHERFVHVIQGQVTGAGNGSNQWSIALSDGTTIRAPVVVNCLWESRPAIDRKVRPSIGPVSIRYKQALFGSAVASLAGLAPSTRILGPYGDVVTYANGDAYLSWYPAGLVGRSDDGTPPAMVERDPVTVTTATLAGLGLPASVLADAGAEWRLEGGYVVARGFGDIDQRSSPLHERHRPGVNELRPGFISVDTGKYTLAPLLAERALECALRAYAEGRPRAKTYVVHG